MQDIVKNLLPKWNIQNKIRDLMDGSKPGNQQAKRNYTVETLRALKDKLPKTIINAMGEETPGPFGKLFDQIDKAHDYDTGISKSQLIKMLLSRDADRRANASQILGDRITTDMAAKWLHNKEALRDDYYDKHRYDIRTWAKGSPIITKEQMVNGEADKSHPMYEFSKLKQNAEYGIPGAATALKNKIEDIENKLGPSERRLKIQEDLKDAAVKLNNILNGIKLDVPGANDEE